MFEHATLQEAYTGALIAGKGKTLNNIRDILERTRLPTGDWARVRFGAGTPWRRCWCVITPPDEKEVQKLQKQATRKKSAYSRENLPALKGTIKFYDTKKIKKARPIATISDAYSAFAIYPQSKPLIDASTLIKLEGSITIESDPPSTTEGFVFVMPEAHAAVSGFEILLRWLFPAFDTFALYGRPTRLIADINDTRSLMFAMPKQRRYGYLEILDVTGLILEQGSSNWREGEWRKRMKELTAKRMTAIESGNRRESTYGSRRSTRNSFGPSRSRGVQFDDGVSIRSQPSITWNHPPQVDGSSGIPRVDSAPPGAPAFATPANKSKLQHQHHRSVSETDGLDRFQNQSPAQYDSKYEQGPPPPPHVIGISTPVGQRFQSGMAPTPERLSSEDERVGSSTPVRELQDLQSTSTPEPVAAPPAFQHAPGSLPVAKPYHSPELRRANSRMSTATLAQLAGASGVVAAYQTTEEHRRQNEAQTAEDKDQRGVMSDATTKEFRSNQSAPSKGLAEVSDAPRFSFEQSPARPTNNPSSHSHPLPVIPFNPAAGSHSRPATRQDDTSSPIPAPQTHSHPPATTSGHKPHTSTDSTQNTSRNNRQSISRKPIPVRGTSVDNTNNSQQASYPVIDQAAYDRIRQSVQYPTPMNSDQRLNSGLSSIYSDDNASTASPDYASTHRSVEARQPADRPRAGVMRTVGNNEEANANAQSSVPEINFGPTLNYAAVAPKPLPPQPQGRQSPGPTLTQHAKVPIRRPESSGQSRSPHRNVVTPDNLHIRTESAGSRTMAWQPGMAAPGGSVSPGGRQGITAEEFVQQRANARPMYAHQRQASSSGNLNSPPLVRNRSSELLTQLHSRNNSTDVLQRPASRSANTALGHHSRNNSTDMLQRPSSRGATTTLGPSGNGDIASKLSAREQEHVARVTGQPLINMAQNRRDSQQGAGLVGAIQQREIEKQQAKQGLSSQVVQNAINQRQQQQQQQAYSQAQYGGNMSQQQPRGQNQYKPAAHQAYWAASPTTGAVHNYHQKSSGQITPRQQSQQQGQQSPQYFPQQQQSQYFPSQQEQSGKNNHGYHGHGT